MIEAKTKEDIENNIKSKGSRDIGMKALKQGKPVFICSPDDDVDETVDKIMKETEKNDS